MAGATLGGSLTGGFLLLLLFFDLAAQAFHFLFAGGLFLGGGLFCFLGGLLGSLFCFLGRLFRCLLSLLAGLFLFLGGGLLGGCFLAGGMGLGGAALELLLGRIRVYGVAVAAHDGARLVDAGDRVGGGGTHDGGGCPDANRRDRGGVTLRVQDGHDGLARAQGGQDLVEFQGRLREGLHGRLELLEVIGRRGAQAVLDA